MTNTTVGGGIKKILYALRTARRIGLKDSAKALTSKNGCKACALGMGGQAGGMTNELGEFRRDLARMAHPGVERPGNIDISRRPLSLG